jgi:hypothetical protein
MFLGGRTVIDSIIEESKQRNLEPWAFIFFESISLKYNTICTYKLIPIAYVLQD